MRLGLTLGVVLALAAVAQIASGQDGQRGWNPMHFKKLSDAELRKCQEIASVPQCAEHPSLNLSQAVMIFGRRRCTAPS